MDVTESGKDVVDWLVQEVVQPVFGVEDTMTTPNRILIDSFRGLLKESHLDRGEPIRCDTCSNVLDAFAELVIRGLEVPELMPLVRGHLDNCDRCRAEFETLVADLRTSE